FVPASARVGEGEMKRANWIGAPQYFQLNHACMLLAQAFGHGIYLVGSSMERRDFRDVDVRCMLEDQDFDRLFPPDEMGGARWSIMNVVISQWLAAQSDLPVDFQFQSQIKANRDYGGGKRSALSILPALAPRAAR